MTELNKEIINEIRKLNCDNSMKSFIENMLKFELELIDSESNESTKSIGTIYKSKIAEFSKQWGSDDEI